MKLEVLVEIGLVSGTEYVAPYGIAAEEQYYSARLLGISGVRREIDTIPGDFRASEFAITLDDADGYWSELKANVPFFGIEVRVLLGDLDEGFSDFEPLAIGTCSGWSKQGDAMTLQVQGASLVFLDQPFPLVTSATAFPDLPAGAQVNLVPIVYGTIAAAGGALPAYLVDATNFHYVLALGDVHDVTAIYVDGVELDSGWTVETATYAEQECTRVVFDSDQGDAVVTWDGQGLEDADGNNITNPVRQWQALLELQGFAVDADLFDEAAAAIDSRGVHGAVAVTQTAETLRSVADRMAASFNIDTHITADGRIGVSVPAPGGGTVVKTLTAADFAADGLATRNTEHTYTGIAYEYETLYTDAAKYLSGGSYEEVAQVRIQRRPVSVRLQMPYVRAAAPAANVVQDRMFFAREERVEAVMTVNPAVVRGLAIGDTVAVTHFRGIGEDGFENVPMRVTGLGMQLDQDGLVGTITAIDVRLTVYPVGKQFLRYSSSYGLPRTWTTTVRGLKALAAAPSRVMRLLRPGP